MRIKEFLARNEVEIFVVYKGTEKSLLPYCNNLKFDVWNCEIYSNISGECFKTTFTKTTEIRRRNKPVDPTQEEVFRLIIRNNIDFRKVEADADKKEEDVIIDKYLRTIFKEDATKVIYEEELYD